MSKRFNSWKTHKANSQLGLGLVLLLSFSLSAFSQSRVRTEHWRLRNQQFEAELDTISRGQVVFLGNSITEGFPLEDYFPGKGLINRGIKGDHLDGLLERINNSAVGLKPKKLFLMIGINDIGDRRSDDYLKWMFTVLIDSLVFELPDTQIYLHSILPTTARWKNCPPEQIQRMNAYLEDLAETRDLVFVDLYLRLLDGGDRLNPDYTMDGLHLNRDGYALWAKEIRPYLE